MNINKISLLTLLWFLMAFTSCNHNTEKKAMDLEKVLDEYKIATSEFLKGNADHYKLMFSHQDDVTLSNPMYPTVRGWDKVSNTLDKTASRLREGEFIRANTISKYITPELAYVVSIAEEKAKIDGSQEIRHVTLRTTMILRPEDNTWKVVHLHGEFIIPPTKDL